MNAKKYIISAILAGSILALLSAIPYLSSINCCCCLWVIVGGFWAAYLFRSAGETPSLGQSIGIGVLTGIWAAFLYSILTAILWYTMSDQFITQFAQVMETSSTEIPPEMLELFADFSESPVFAFLIVFSGALFIFPICTTIGSIIGSLILKKRENS